MLYQKLPWTTTKFNWYIMLHKMLDDFVHKLQADLSQKKQQLYWKPA